MQNSTLQLTQVSQFSSANVNSASWGMYFQAIAGTTTNGDLLLSDDSFITGGVLHTSGTTLGDYVTFQVVDIDNVMGYGPGVVLGEYMSNWYLQTDSQKQLDENIQYPAKIRAGLYLRVKYVSVGLLPVKVYVNYRLHRALY